MFMSHVIDFVMKYGFKKKSVGELVPNDLLMKTHSGELGTIYYI